MVGAPLYDQRNGEMVFRPGPVFTQLLLADEINRTPPKTQAALLEAMGEGQVSVDGESRRLPPPFIVLATDNPIEYEGTYELPEAQLDRFLMRLRLGYLTAGDETDMLRRRVDRAAEAVALAPVTDAAGLLAMRESLERVEISDDLLDYVIAIVTATRKDPQIQVGASPARRPGAGPAGPRPGAAAPARLRGARRHQAGRGPGARAPDHAPARAVGPPGLRRRRGRAAAVRRPDPAHRPDRPRRARAAPGPARSPADATGPAERAAAPERPASAAGDGRGASRPISARRFRSPPTRSTVRWRPSRHARRLLTLAAAGLLLAVLTRRPELAGLAGPPLLLLGAGRATRGALPGRPGSASA